MQFYYLSSIVSYNLDVAGVDLKPIKRKYYSWEHENILSLCVF